MLRIITDSSAEITEEEAKELGSRIVPRTVVFGNEAFIEERELKKDEFYRRLVGGEFPHSSLPSAQQFIDEFVQTEGEETLVILLSSALSGAVEAARLAVR